jgi:hypothetical protein
MIIKIKQTTTTEKEIEINFPYFTFDDSTNKFYMNYELNKCIQISKDTNSILHFSTFNDGLEFKEISKTSFYNSFDSNMQELLTILNK